MEDNKHDPRTCINSKPCFDCEYPIKEDIDPITGKLSKYHIEYCPGCALCDLDFDTQIPDDYEEYKDNEIKELNSK